MRAHTQNVEEDAMPGLKDNYMIAVKEAQDLGLGARSVVLICDADALAERITLLIDKRFYEVRVVNETETGVEIDIDRRAPK
jgi:hypothetical protein